MHVLLQTVENYLASHCLQIQPSKSIVVSNFTGKEYHLNYEGESRVIERAYKRDIINYLGTPMSILKNRCSSEQIIKEILHLAAILQAKKLSTSIISYVINAVLIPLISYRIQGNLQNITFYSKIESILCGLVKRTLGLPRSYSHKLLQSSILPIGIRNLQDYHEEQEISNLMFWLNSDGPTSRILRSYLRENQLCYPIFSDNYYETKSKYINNMWKVPKKNDLSCIPMLDIHSLKNREFTCQYFSKIPHDT